MGALRPTRRAAPGRVRWSEEVPAPGQGWGGYRRSRAGRLGGEEAPGLAARLPAGDVPAGLVGLLGSGPAAGYGTRRTGVRAYVRVVRDLHRRPLAPRGSQGRLSRPQARGLSTSQPRTMATNRAIAKPAWITVFQLVGEKSPTRAPTPKRIAHRGTQPARAAAIEISTMAMLRPRTTGGKVAHRVRPSSIEAIALPNAGSDSARSRPPNDTAQCAPRPMPPSTPRTAAMRASTFPRARSRSASSTYAMAMAAAASIPTTQLAVKRPAFSRRNNAYAESLSSGSRGAMSSEASCSTGADTISAPTAALRAAGVAERVGD